MRFKELLSRRNKALYFSFWDCLFPKNNTKVVIVAKNRTEFSGNLRVVTDVLLSENKHKIYVYKDGMIIPEIKTILESKGVTVLEGWSTKSLYHLLTSGIFIFSHAPRDAHITKRCKNRIIINLWHGVAFKTIENLMPDISETKQKQIETNAKLYDIIIASSEADKQTNMSAFMIGEEKVKITGLPRYDLLKESYPLDDFLTKQKKKLIAYKQNKTLILYAPTFREHNISAIEQITNEEWDMLTATLTNNNAIMGIRPHSYDTAIPTYIDNNEHFFWLPHSTFTETNLILQQTDILLVDFSSIWIDYLLLHRPIVGFAKDFQHYLDNERGFVYDYQKTFPGDFTSSINTLTIKLEELLTYATNETSYETTKTLFHQYPLNTDFSKLLSKVLPVKDYSC